jgi:pSer/pThr/pTyr-binding forkhead associated (FHA) protein
MIEGLKFLIYSPEGVREVKCFDFPCTVGRSMDCQVRLRGVGFSRKHLEVSVEGDEIYITNLTETNPSHINRSLMAPMQKIQYREKLEIRFSRVKDTYIAIEKTSKENDQVLPFGLPEDEMTNSKFAFSSEDETYTNFSLAGFEKSNSVSSPSAPRAESTPPSFMGNTAQKIQPSPEMRYSTNAQPQTDAEYLRLQEEKRKLMEAENEQLREQIVKKMRLEAEEEGWRIKQAAMQEAEQIKQQAVSEIHQAQEQSRRETADHLRRIQEDIKKSKRWV